MLRRPTPATRQRGAIVRVRLVIQRRQLSTARAVLHHCPQVPEDGLGVFLARNELRAAGAALRGRELPVRLDADKIDPAAAQRAPPQQRRQQAVLEPAWSKAVKSAGFGGGSLKHPKQWLGVQWPASWKCELPRAARRALRRRRSRAGALPREAL